MVPQQDVRGLEIPVHHALRVGVADAVAGLLHRLDHGREVPALLGLGIAPAPGDEHLVQVPPRHPLHRVVQAAVGEATGVVHRDDVGVLELPGDADLPVEVGGPAGVRLVDMQHLEGDVAAEVAVEDELDVALAPLAQRGEPLVARGQGQRRVAGDDPPGRLQGDVDAAARLLLDILDEGAARGGARGRLGLRRGDGEQDRGARGRGGDVLEGRERIRAIGGLLGRRPGQALEPAEAEAAGRGGLLELRDLPGGRRGPLRGVDLLRGRVRSARLLSGGRHRDRESIPSGFRRARGTFVVAPPGRAFRATQRPPRRPGRATRPPPRRGSARSSP